MLAVQETASTEKVNIEKEVTDKLANISNGVTDKIASPVAPKFDKSKFAMPSMDQLTIGPDGMPKISAKPQAQSIPAAVKASEKQALQQQRKKRVNYSFYKMNIIL